MWRKVYRFWLVILFLLSQKANASQYAFQITFTDKNNSPYSLTSPLDYLSSRALIRRLNQGINIDSTDLPVNQHYVDSVLTLTGGRLHGTSRWFNMCFILLSDSSQILNLTGKAFIYDIKKVGYYPVNLHRPASYITNPAISNAILAQSPFLGKPGSTGAGYYGTAWPQTEQVRGNYLNDKGYQGQGKLIAIFDAGFIGTNIHIGFDSMWLSGRVVDTYNFNTRTTGVFVEDVHGTECLSTIAGNLPGSFVGTAPYASFALYVTDIEPGDQPLELDNMVMAAERADSIGADVITESLGYDLWDNPMDGQVFDSLDGKTTMGAKAANMATKKGILFVATAGNDGAPTVSGWGNHILTPGDADSALTIGAVDLSGTAAPFSGYGPNAASRIKPDVCGMGVGTYCLNAGATTGISTASGTSISTPQIAGWAACLMQANPNSTPFKIRQAIIHCASSYYNPGIQLGYGIPDFECVNNWLDVKDVPPAFSSAKWVIPSPNPFHDELNLLVSANDNQIASFIIMDMQGHEVYSSQAVVYVGYNTPITLSISNLPAGIYTLKAMSATQYQVVKLVKR